MHTVNCTEIWGGVKEADADIRTSGVVASLYSSAAHGGRGGDIYYISVCSSDLLTRVALADVTGHGKPVSDISEWLYDALRDRMNDLDGNTILAELNVLAWERGYEAMSTAAVIGFYRIDYELFFSYAGHPPVFVYRQKAKRWESITLESRQSYANLPLGAFRDVIYDQELRPVTAGDRLFLYTDGVIDAPSRDGRFFGTEGILAALEQASEGTSHDLKRAVGEALRDHTGGSLAHDDVTFMVLEIL